MPACLKDLDVCSHHSHVGSHNRLQPIMFVTCLCLLFRFDRIYYSHFKCNVRRIAGPGGYPNLWAFAREVYQTPGVAATCDLEVACKHYYKSHTSLNQHPVAGRWRTGSAEQLLVRQRVGK